MKRINASTDSSAVRNRAFTLLLLLASAFSSNAQAEAQIFKFGIVPQAAATKLAETWTPLLAYLSEASGLDLRFVTAKNIPIFETRLAEGEYDVAYMNPYHYTVFHEKPGYHAFASPKNTKLRGIIVVHKDSLFTDVPALANNLMGFPAPASFAATVIPLAFLNNNHVKVTPKFLGSHDSVYLNVAQKRVAAGGGVVQTLGAMPEDVKNQLRILWMSESYTPHALAAHPRLSADVISRLSAAMISLDNDPKGRELLSAVGLPGFMAARDSQWDDVRALNIKLLEPLLQE